MNNNKKYDVRKVYVCAIGLQDEVEEHLVNLYGDTEYRWGYTGIRIALCEKALLGYRHILTGQTYRVASPRTAMKMVVKKNPIMPWLKYDERVAKIIARNNSYNVNIDVIDKAEQVYNKIFQEQKQNYSR